jgi:hypothetical protein
MLSSDVRKSRDTSLVPDFLGIMAQHCFPAKIHGAIALADAGFGNRMCPCRDATNLVIPSITDTVGRLSLNMLCGPCKKVDDNLHTLASPKSAAPAVGSVYRIAPPASDKRVSTHGCT